MTAIQGLMRDVARRIRSTNHKAGTHGPACARTLGIAALAVCAVFPPAGLAGDQSRGMRSSCSTQFEATPGPGGLDVTLTGTCNLAHLGITHHQSTQQVIFTGPDTLAITNQITYTAANGDELYATFLGTGVIAPDLCCVTFTGLETFGGGTGRFVNAAGAATLTGGAQFIVFPISGIGSYEARGRISY